MVGFALPSIRPLERSLKYDSISNPTQFFPPQFALRLSIPPRSPDADRRRATASREGNRWGSWDFQGSLQGNILWRVRAHLRFSVRWAAVLFLTHVWLSILVSCGLILFFSSWKLGFRIPNVLPYTLPSCLIPFPTMILAVVSKKYRVFVLLRWRRILLFVCLLDSYRNLFEKILEFCGWFPNCVFMFIPVIMICYDMDWKLPIIYFMWSITAFIWYNLTNVCDCSLLPRFQPLRGDGRFMILISASLSEEESLVMSTWPGKRGYEL